MKKIAVILNTEPNWGGEHQYAICLMDCLLQSHKYDLFAFCGSTYWADWCEKNKIRYVKNKWYRSSEKDILLWMKYPLYFRVYHSFLLECGKRIRKEKIQLIICAQQGTVVPPIFCKVLHPVHDIMHRYEGGFPEIVSSYEGREILFKSVAEFSSVILTDSQLGKEQFIESFHENIGNRLKIYPLPYCVPDNIVKSKEEMIQTPQKYIFYPAQIWGHKNHINLLRAVNILKDKIQDIHLILVGSEKEKIVMAELQNYIMEHQLEEYISWYGFVSDGNLKYLYRHAVAMVMPTYFGPTNLPPLEAMALGCPVAASGKYAMKEQVGDAGLLFNPDSAEEIADCIYRIWTDEKLRDEMKKLGYQRMKRWNKQRFQERLIKIIDRI